MKTKFIASLSPILLALFASLSVHGQTSAFTYQGRLNQNGSSFTGSAEFQPTLWDAVVNGTQIAANSPAQVIVPVTNGLFTLPLDFGANFPGADRWLQLEVRTTIGAFTLLSPRTQLTPTPYAITANTASNLSGTLPAAQISGPVSSANFSGTYSNALTFNNVSNSFAGSGAGLTSVNAESLDGFDSSSFWKLGGNSGITPGTQFFGTTDNQPVEVKVNNQRAWRIAYATNNANSDSPNIIAGRSNNTVAANVVGATISGGGRSGSGHQVNADFGSVGGGWRNLILSGSGESTVGGGSQNIISNAFQGVIGGGSGNRIFGGDFGSGVSSIAGGINNSIGVTNSGGGTVVFEGGHFIGGGNANRIGPSLLYSAIGGGIANLIESGESAIGGGANNRIEPNGFRSTIGGGGQNTNSGNYATVPGGQQNVAAGNHSFAAGLRAKAIHPGAFVWADSQNADFTSTGTNQFIIRAAGGVGIGSANPNGATLRVQGAASTGEVWISPTTSSGNADIFLSENVSGSFGMKIRHNGASNTLEFVGVQNSVENANPAMTIGRGTSSGVAIANSLEVGGSVGIGTNNPSQKLHVIGNILATGTITPNSDRNAKTDFAAVNTSEILERVVGLPIQEWRFHSEQPGVKHVGPMAQDFRAAFGLGEHPTAIATVDADGIALAAIQGLNQKLEEQRTENAALKHRLVELEKLVTTLANKGN